MNASFLLRYQIHPQFQPLGLWRVSSVRAQFPIAAKPFSEMPIQRFEANGSDLEVEDVFDRLPDDLLSVIFTIIADVKTLIRCSAVNKRFNSLVRQVDLLVLQLDRLGYDTDSSFLRGFFKSISLVNFIAHHLASSSSSSPQSSRSVAVIKKSPAHILKGFEGVEKVLIELPHEDLRVESGEFILWKAFFGKSSLRGCVVVGMRSVNQKSVGVGAEYEGDMTEGLNMGAEWMVSALTAACRWHHAVKEVARDHKGMKWLVVRDKEGKSSMAMDCKTLREEEGVTGNQGRITVPAARLKLWYTKKVELLSGKIVEGATVVVARPADAPDVKTRFCCSEEKRLARAAFGGFYGEIVECLIKGAQLNLIIIYLGLVASTGRDL